MASRLIGELTYQDVAKSLKATSILCLPLGSMEQHGPHLPLDTDLVIAEAFTQAIVAKHGDAFDLWQLPALPFGLSREHEWAAGTMSLSVGGMTALAQVERVNDGFLSGSRSLEECDFSALVSLRNYNPEATLHGCAMQESGLAVMAEIVARNTARDTRRAAGDGEQ